ncbi:hypothetical protein ABIF68_005644 [Bradyrhizobium japonicum]|jgi:hypothetical protein|nr:hypothetical protein [Bradyrhizobium japonicum]MCP1778924.1 hypothetical protein [Bradyrhizobium japonicum]MCW2322034.1 hypothetical protein [Bradyrhizobium japonicum]
MADICDVSAISENKGDRRAPENETDESHP